MLEQLPLVEEKNEKINQCIFISHMSLCISPLCAIWWTYNCQICSLPLSR